MRNSINKKEILKSYVSYVSIKSKRPKSFKSFAKRLNIEEKALYSYFSNFDQVEAEVYTYFMKRTIKLLRKEKFDDKNEFLLALYYTFFEHLTAIRTYIKTIAKIHFKKYEKLKTLTPLKQLFISHLEEHSVGQSIPLPDPIGKFQNKIWKEAAWSHFMFVFAFWLKDKSPGLEKTDMLIEKSLRLIKDLEHSPITDSALDFGKFMFKELKKF